MADRSIVENFRDREGYRCGYCGNSDTNYSHGIWAHQLTCEDYQDLIDRGWRRSGKYCYKPAMDKMCCPCYPIRCAALEFKATKSQKKVLKRMTKFLTAPKTETAEGNQSKTSNSRLHEDSSPSDFNEAVHDVHQPSKLDDELKGRAINTDRISGQIGSSLTSRDGKSKSEMEDRISDGKTSSMVDVRTEGQKTKDCSTPSVGADPTKPPCRKAKGIRRERRQQKMLARGVEVDALKASASSNKNKEKSLEEFLIESLPGTPPAHKLEVKLVRVDMECAEFRSTHNQSHKVFEKYQMTVHKDTPDECTEKQYKRFLVDSPLIHCSGPGTPSMGYGSFHQQYWLDGKLIAVGVVDILPRCISSVYLFYDPDYSFLSIGVYSALREVQLTRQLHTQSPNLCYYYMGFYIHSCPKMIYKGNYYPSFLACPETYRWTPIEHCRPKLDASKYSRLDNTAEVSPSTDINTMLVLYRRQAMPYLVYKAIKYNEDNDDDDDDDDESEIQELADMIDPLVATRMLLFRS